MGRLRLLFVCRGNTCRSPMAECIMRHLVKEYELPWTCDSAGLRSWNVGRRPDERCLKVLDENGMTTTHYGRMVTVDDFVLFDYILGLDELSVRELEDLAANLDDSRCRAKVVPLGSYLKNCDDESINDPFFSRNLSGFRCTFDQIYKCCENFIEDRKKDRNSDLDPLVQSF
ncbi:hypothetical protein DOY81_003977 [Sarcophaga bullata]|nr:hypothetical protein DOY81_003977 [Sarcophaga bullata]